MAEHYQKVYPNEKYHCPDKLCTKQFDKKDQVQSHIKTSHKDLKYKCEPCNIQFTKENILRNHNKRVHSG